MKKAGPSFPDSIPDSGSYEPRLPTLSARERVRNYSVETLDRLVPPPIENYDFHGFRTTQVVDGFTQDSYINHDSSSFGGGEFGTNSDDDDLQSLQSQPFSRSLEVPTAPRTGIARECLRPHLEELFTVLDRLNDNAEMESVGKLILVAFSSREYSGGR